MSDFPSLAELLAQHGFLSTMNICACQHGLNGNFGLMNPDQWRAHVAAAWREACTIRTVEQLDALPAGAIVRSRGEVAYERARTPGSDWYGTNLATVTGSDIGLPALCIWHPSWEVSDA